MQKIIKNIKYFFTSPDGVMKLHLILTIFWLLMIPVGLIWLRESVPLLVIVTIYANLVGHWSNYLTAKSEKKIDKIV